MTCRIDVFIDAAVVGVKISVAPLISRVGRFLVIVPGIIDAHGNHVFSRRRLHEFGDVEAKGHHAVFVAADKFAVEIKLAAVANAFKLEKDFLAGSVGGQA